MTIFSVKSLHRRGRKFNGAREVPNPHRDRMGTMAKYIPHTERRPMPWDAYKLRRKFFGTMFYEYERVCIFIKQIDLGHRVRYQR